MKITVHHPRGAYGTRVNGFTNRSLASQRGCLQSPASTAAAPNGTYDYAASGAIPGTLSYEDSEYFVSPEVSITPA